MSMSEEQKKANRRLGLTLASIAIAFFIGFMVKSIVFR